MYVYIILFIFSDSASSSSSLDVDQPSLHTILVKDHGITKSPLLCGHIADQRSLVDRHISLAIGDRSLRERMRAWPTRSPTKRASGEREKFRLARCKLVLSVHSEHLYSRSHPHTRT